MGRMQGEASVMKLVDVPDSKSGPERGAGSSPARGTITLLGPAMEKLFITVGGTVVIFGVLFAMAATTEKTIWMWFAAGGLWWAYSTLQTYLKKRATKACQRATTPLAPTGNSRQKEI